MARWKLNSKHYLPVPGTEFDYKETDDDTGKQARKVFPVPLFLDPDSPSDRNYPGEIIVAHADGAYQRKDIIFTGPPTPEMEPLDEEAEAITEAMRVGWGKQFMEESAESTSDRVVRELADTMTLAFGKTGRSSPIAEPSAELEALKAQVAELTTLLKGKPDGEASGVQSSPVEDRVQRRR